MKPTGWVPYEAMAAWRRAFYAAVGIMFLVLLVIELRG